MKEPFTNDNEKLKVDEENEDTSKKKCQLTFCQKMIIIAIIFTIWTIVITN